MTWFSSMVLNPQRRGGRKLLGSPQAMHAAVLAAFLTDSSGVSGSADPVSGKSERVLWRLDSSGHGHRLYIVSPNRPDLTHIVEQAGWLGQVWNSAPYDQLLNRLRTGQEWAFRLTANPVSRGPAAEGKDGQRGKILPHATPAQQTAWLLHKSQSHGFRVREDVPRGLEEPVPDLAVTSRQDERFSHSNTGRGGRRSTVTLRRVQFDGTLQITDAEALRSMLINGIGRGKAYGCGLMTLKKLG